ncbi:serine hydrolase domain-containing protein [Spirillospora sp. CA-294931]|uniref:serine hydrolase domain-containing protein n=1 Tax=Spirillospora sp. CA-294931 TaxID=3240042 RepID=UPI003D8DDDD9
MRIRLVACASAAVLSVGAGLAAVGSAPEERKVAPVGGASGVDPGELKSGLDALHRAGTPGVYAEVRDAGRTWRGASGVADVRTGRPVTPGMLQRVGSVTKTFTATAVLREVERGRIGLDTPIGHYLPRLVPGERGQKVTVRMLLNHTSKFPDYLRSAFPSLRGYPSVPDMSPKSLDDNRLRTFRPAELIKMGLDAPPVTPPGDPTGVYSNTNYLLLGQLLEKVSGSTAEKYITHNVIRPAGLRHTYFPSGPRLRGPHPRMYEEMHGLLAPPRDYSVYNPSWLGTGAALVSTMDDLNRFYARLLAGKVVGPSALEQMRRTVPVYSLTGEKINYGLGLHKVEIPGCGTFWGHDGSVWGAETLSFTSADGGRQMSLAMNLARWTKLDASGKPLHHPVNGALAAFKQYAMCGD